MNMYQNYDVKAHIHIQDTKFVYLQSLMCHQHHYKQVYCPSHFIARGMNELTDIESFDFNTALYFLIGISVQKKV